MITNNIKGKVSHIHEKNYPVVDKSTVRLKINHQQCVFIEFRDDVKKLMKQKGVREGSEISVNVVYEGRVSTKSGIPFNNIIVVDFELI